MLRPTALASLLLPPLLLLLLLLSPRHTMATPSAPTPPRSDSSSHVSGRERHTPMGKRTAQEVIDRLGLAPNVEKGYYAQTFEDAETVRANRSASTAIYYLLERASGPSVWHRVDAAEVWHYYAGAPLVLSLSRDDGEPARERTLGPDVFGGQAPQVVIAKWEWQSARSLGDWTLVGTTVAPGFVTSGYEVAPVDWVPNGA